MNICIENIKERKKGKGKRGREIFPKFFLQNILVGWKWISKSHFYTALGLAL